jgi:hypothetical protein
VICETGRSWQNGEGRAEFIGSNQPCGIRTGAAFARTFTTSLLSIMLHGMLWDFSPAELVFAIPTSAKGPFDSAAGS